MGCKKSKHAVAAGNTITITKPSNGDRLNDKVKEVFHPPVLASDINARSSVQQKERVNVAACKNNGFVDETKKGGGEKGLCKENKGCLAAHVNEKESLNENGFVLENNGGVTGISKIGSIKEGREKDVDKEKEERCLDEQVNVGLDKNNGSIEVVKVESETKLANEGDDVKKEGCLVEQVNENQSEIETLVKDEESEDKSETETEKGGEEENVNILTEGCRVEQVNEEESKSETLPPTKYEYEREEAEKGEENNVDVEYEECLVEQVNENESEIETLSPTKDELKSETDVDIEKEEGLDENESESETLSSSIKDEEENNTSETELVKEGEENDVAVEEKEEEAKENDSENETLSSPTMEVVE